MLNGYRGNEYEQVLIKPQEGRRNGWELEVDRVKGNQSHLDWEKGPWAMNFKPGQKQRRQASLDIKGMCCLTRDKEGSLASLDGLLDTVKGPGREDEEERSRTTY